MFHLRFNQPFFPGFLLGPPEMAMDDVGSCGPLPLAGAACIGVLCATIAPRGPVAGPGPDGRPGSAGEAELAARLVRRRISIPEAVDDEGRCGVEGVAAVLGRGRGA